MKISVVVITCNDGESLFNSIASIKENMGYFEDWEIIIVDNGGINAEYVKSFELNKNIKVIRNEENLGVSKGRNIGYKNASGDLIFSTDGHIVLHAQTILTLERMKKNKKMNIGIFYGEKGFNLTDLYVVNNVNTVYLRPAVMMETGACLFDRELIDKDLLIPEEGVFGKAGKGFMGELWGMNLIKQGYYNFLTFNWRFCHIPIVRSNSVWQVELKEREQYFFDTYGEEYFKMQAEKGDLCISPSFLETKEISEEILKEIYYKKGNF